MKNQTILYKPKKKLKPLKLLFKICFFFPVVALVIIAGIIWIMTFTLSGTIKGFKKSVKTYISLVKWASFTEKEEFKTRLNELLRHLKK